MTYFIKSKRKRKTFSRWFIAYDANSHNDEKQSLRIQAWSKDSKTAAEKNLAQINAASDLKFKIVKNEDYYDDKRKHYIFSFAIDFKTDEDEAEFLLKASAGYYDKLDN